MQDSTIDILVVEDHPFQLIAMQMHLNRMGFFRLTPALDAEEARQACQRREKPFDLLLCDINLPGSDGIELVIELTRDKCVRQAVLLSCRETDELQALEKDLQGNDLPVLACLSKPLDATMLLQALEAAPA